MPRTEHAWFRAKRYGYGWGLPLTWQGWVVLVAYTAVMAVGGIWFARNPGAFVAIMLGASAVLVWICWATGEPPRLR